MYLISDSWNLCRFDSIYEDGNGVWLYSMGYRFLRLLFQLSFIIKD